MELGKLKALAEDVKGWSNCDTAWLDPAEDELAAAVGHISEDGEKYCVTTVDCDQYYAADDSLKLAKFYAAANPATVLGLIDTIENLAALVNRLCRQINKGSVANDVAVKAAEYMYRNNLLSTSLLRDDEGVGKLLDMVNPRKTDARRIAACVNACTGVTTEELEQGGFVAGLVERLEDAPRWRDVVDELPQEAQEVLFVRGGKTVHGAWIGGIFWHSNQKMAAATWMPLPKPPAESKVVMP
jgi:hypothetical protein